MPRAKAIFQTTVVWKYYFLGCFFDDGFLVDLLIVTPYSCSFSAISASSPVLPDFLRPDFRLGAKIPAVIASFSVSWLFSMERAIRR